MNAAARQREPYERLAAVYEADWGGYSVGFLRFVDFALVGRDAPPRSVLDLACGTGDLAAALAGRGWRVVGVDRSPAMLRVARAKEPGAEFREGDMRDFSLGERFDLVTCAFDSFNYLLEREDLRAAFACVKNHLEPDGLFLFDVNTPRLYEEHHHGEIERETGSFRFRQVLRYEPEARLAHTTFLFGEDVEEHLQRAYTRDEVVTELEAAGLRPRAVYGDGKRRSGHGGLEAPLRDLGSWVGPRASSASRAPSPLPAARTRGTLRSPPSPPSRDRAAPPPAGSGDTS